MKRNFTRLTYHISLLVLLIASPVYSVVYAQVADRINGIVLDEQHEGLPGVSITVKRTTKGTLTDMDGKFELEAAQGDTLVVASIGYDNQEIGLTGQRYLNISLEKDNADLEEVVVVGYGTQKKRDVTGAVVSLKAEDLQLATMPQTTITQSLQGRVPGVTITNNAAGAEGNSNTIQIRGKNSITAGNSPLIVVDGVPFSDNLSEINPNDIASIEVLKDASAAAIYGSRAANGVMLVTTKKGQAGKAKIAYNGYYGVDVLSNLPDMMNAGQFYQTKVDRFGESVLTSTEIENHAKGLNTDWVDLATRTGSRQQHSLAVSGGTEQTHYYLSGTYNGVKGIARNDQFDRLNIRLNVDTKITPWLTLGTNTQLGYYKRNGIAANFTNAFTMNPLVAPYEADGTTLRLTPWAEDAYFNNPLEGLNVINEDITRSAFSNNYIKIDIPFIPGLSYRLNTGYSYRYRNTETYYGNNTRDGLQQKGVAQVENWNYEDWLVENIIDYNRDFGKHTIGFTGLYSAQSRTTKIHDLDANGFPGDFMTYYQNSLATVWAPTDEYSKQNYISQMARLNYSYDGKYLLTATIRRDGYSAFGVNSKYGIFPSLALGWNMSEESFLKQVSWVDQLKLRASYGKNGNQAINPYATLPQLAIQPYLNNNGETAIGFYPNRLGDPDLSWETTNKTNIGTDFSLFKGRIQGSIDYYNSRTHDLLLSKLISPVNGTKNILQNVGEVKNYGLEFAVSTQNIAQKDFGWTTDFNISFNRNKIVDVGLYDANGNPVDDVSNRWFIGKPIDVNYSYVFDGIWQEGEDIAGSAQPTAKAGDVKVKDINGDGKIDADDRAVIGSAVPSYIAGMTNTFRYKNFSLSIFIRTVQGTTKFNDLMNTYFDGRNAAMNREWWSPGNAINTYPANRDDANPFGVNYFGNTSNSSFVKLSDITLRYTLPERVLSHMKFSSLEVYFNLKNVATISPWKGMDPELDSQTGIPLSRTYLLGLRFGF